VGTLGVTLLVFVATVIFGGVHGSEFCPQTFERRSYSYYELPVVRIQVTGERNEDLTGPTEQYVRSQKYFTAVSGKKDWHVLVGSQGTRLRRPGDAGILVQYFDAEQGGDVHRWVDWSEENEELAKIVWPAAQQLALNDAYVFIPDLFDLAKTLDCDELLKPAVQKLLKSKVKQAEAVEKGAAEGGAAESNAAAPKGADGEATNSQRGL
jgi:hypothetical protein